MEFFLVFYSTMISILTRHDFIVKVLDGQGDVLSEVSKPL